MEIKSIELNNFRQFKGGNNRIEFSRDPECNITLILGDNTSGKTTLLQAFLWCLYGTAKFGKNSYLLNEIVAQEMIQQRKKQESTSVTIELVHDNTLYTIHREQFFSVSSADKIVSKNNILTVQYKEEKGQTKTVLDVDKENVIQEILPEGLSNYFFYDTERFGNISVRRQVGNAVKGLLGLTVLENLKNHLGHEAKISSVIGGLSNGLSAEGDEEAKIAKQKANKAYEESERLTNYIEQTEIELEKYWDKVRIIQEELKGIESVSKLQRKKEELEKKLQDEKTWIERQKSEYYKNFNQNTYLFFSRPLISKALNTLQSADVIDKGIKNMHADSILHIIKRGKCICGTEINYDSEHYQHLMSEMEYLPPKSIGLTINNFKDSLNSWNQYGENFYENLDSYYKNKLKGERNVYSISREIKSLDEQIFQNIDAGHKEKHLKHSQQRIKELEETKSKYIGEKNFQQHIITEQNRKYQSLTGLTNKNRQIKIEIAYAKKMLEKISGNLGIKEKEIKVKLEEKVNYYFKQIYHGKRSVKIDDDFKVTLITTTNNKEIKTDESQGLETVKNFSFIAGLVDLAKEKLLDDYNLGGDLYPLVLDAPFSNTDSTHVSNISHVLPKVANQLILIVMAKDWNYADEAMRHKVGKEYIIIKESEVHSVLKEV